MVGSIESVEDLKEIGIKAIQAKALFKLVQEWVSHGLSVGFVSEIGRLSTDSRTVTSNELYMKVSLYPFWLVRVLIFFSKLFVFFTGSR